mgnify:CR=1 FL=1
MELESNYSKRIEILYGHKRDKFEDIILSNCISQPHIFKIEKRTDLTHLEIFTIDPENSNDADDGFSFFYKNNKLYLAIHIADPTHFIPLHSQLWKNIETRITTKYPSNRDSISLLPNELENLCSLKTNKYQEKKLAISIIWLIETNTMLPSQPEIFFSEITVQKTNSFTYNNACPSKFSLCLQISKAIKQKRLAESNSLVISDTTSVINYIDSKPTLVQDSLNSTLFKEMISEFAILTNGLIANILSEGIFRECDAKTLENVNLKEIIKNGIQAKYTNNKNSHDLIGLDKYCHFTSPIRRLPDCICHYLLKSLLLNLPKPFTNQQLQILSKKCLDEIKKDKKIGHLDNKFRLFQYIYLLLNQNQNVEIQFYITKNTGLFVNTIINKINNHTVHISYSLKIKNDKIRNQKIITEDNVYKIKINTIDFLKENDELPELDLFLSKLIK